MQNHKGIVLWLTGLSGAGKSTLAYAVHTRLQALETHAIVLDGDRMRMGLCRDLGFSRTDRKENIRRIGEVARLMADAGLVVLAAAISPFQEDRLEARTIIGDERFLEIYCQCPLEVCRERDVKGLYRRAAAGEIPEFTGISSPYEIPAHPDLVLETARHGTGECVQMIMQTIEKNLR
jgi:adenylylsulfate kinase